jgi:hypothetical protein
MANRRHPDLSAALRDSVRCLAGSRITVRIPAEVWTASLVNDLLPGARIAADELIADIAALLVEWAAGDGKPPPPLARGAALRATDVGHRRASTRRSAVDRPTRSAALCVLWPAIFAGTMIYCRGGDA